MKKYIVFIIALLILTGGLFYFNDIFSLNLKEKDFVSSEVAVKWFDLQIDLIKNSPNYTPPVVARIFGYSGTVLYESVLPGMSNHNSLLHELGFGDVVPKFDKSKKYNWEIVANESLSEVTKAMFLDSSLEKRNKIDGLKLEIEEKYIDIDPEIIRSSKEWGQEVAQSIIKFSEDDGGNGEFLKNYPSKFEPVIGEGKWVETPPKYQKALLPYWGENRFFVSEAKNGCVLEPHPEFSTDKESDFYKEAYEVYETTGSLTKEENAIAVFWADDPGKTSTPPGHWISILNSILKKNEYSLFESSEIYARLGIALSDSFISCWDEKYKFNLIRPITYIQEHIDSNWNTPVITDPVITPPFPEYPSGHSVQSGAAATVLTNYFGEDFEFVDHTNDSLGYEPRVFKSFTEAASEAAISRLYGGIHYRAAIENGIDLGNCIGEKVNNIKLHL